MIQLVHDAKAVVRRDRFINLAEIEQLTGIRKSTIYSMMAKGEFPKPVQIGPKMVRWPESEVLQWIQDCINRSRSEKRNAIKVSP